MRTRCCLVLSLALLCSGSREVVGSEFWRVGGWAGSGLWRHLPLASEPQPPPSAIEDVIGQFVALRLAEEGVAPAPAASEATLVRRVTLDLAGRIPAAAEVKAFLGSANPDKLAALVERLMRSDEFADYMAARFDWFITRGDGRIADYLKAAFRERLGWDRMFRDIVLADLRQDQATRAIEFLQRRVGDTDRLTNDVSVAFFGVNISCARCHDHFLAPDWTQDHYYGMKSFFSRTFDNGGFIAERDYGSLTFKTRAGEERQAEPMFLTSTIVETGAAELTDDERREREKVFEECKKKEKAPPPPQSSLRERLVEIALADGENKFFARAIVNRLWHHFFGIGLVSPLDQMHSENPPSHPELLDWLARDLIEHEYDLRRLIRGIVLSDPYARSSFWESDDRPFPHTFAVAMPRPLTPTQLARSLSLATSDPKEFDGLTGEQLQVRVAEAAAPRDRDRFDQPSEDFRVPAAESLWFTNSEKFAEQYLQDGLVMRLNQMDEPRERIEAAVWAVLSRPAAEEEIALLAEYLTDRSERPEEACRQMVWALLAGSEFRFNY